MGFSGGDFPGRQEQSPGVGDCQSCQAEVPMPAVTSAWGPR